MHPYLPFDLTTTYPAGTVTDYYDTDTWRLYQAGETVTGEAPNASTSWFAVTNPLIISGAAEPNFVHEDDPNGPACLAAPEGSVYIYTPTEPDTLSASLIFVYNPTYWGGWFGLIDNSNDRQPHALPASIQADGYGANQLAYLNSPDPADVWAGYAAGIREGTGDGNALVKHRADNGSAGAGDAIANLEARRAGDGDGDAYAYLHATKIGSGAGDAKAYLWADGDNGEAKLEAVSSPEFTGIVATGLPTSDPAIDGALWNDAGTLKVSAG